MIEQVNSMPRLGSPIRAADIPGRASSLSPAYNRQDLGYGSFRHRLEAGGKAILNLDLVRSSVSDGAANLTIQVSAATTVRVTTMPRSVVDSERERVAALGALSANTWVDVTVAAGAIVALPENATGVYLESAGVSVVTLRGA